MGKVNCSLIIEYLREKERMCKHYLYEQKACSQCPLNSSTNGHRTYCREMIYDHPEDAIRIVQKWSDEHPEKTIKDDFLKKYPNARLDAQGTPICCARSLGYYVSECYNDCEKCWNRPLSEVKK